MAFLEIVSPLLASQLLIHHPFVLGSWLLAALSGAEQVIGNILLLAFVGGITYTGVVRMRRSEARRTRQIEAALSGLGFTLHEELEELHVRFVGSFKIGQHGDSREIANRFESTLYADGITTLMDYSFWKGSGKHRHVIRQTLALISDKRYELPSFVLAPENFFSRFKENFGAQDIDFEAFPNFSQMFNLRGDDEAAVRALFTPAIIRELERHPGITLEGRAGNLLIFRFKKRVKPENFPRFLEEAQQLAQLFLP